MAPGLGRIVLAAVLSLAPMAATAQPAPVRIILIGDSTIAPRTGWGDAFCAELVPSATCLNLAKGGRSSLSYRREGLWDLALAEMKRPGPWRATYLIFSFGHNDQPGKGDRTTNLATEFPANMRRYIDEARAVGVTPILLTPLARRQFRNGMLVDTLAPWSAAIRRGAAETKTPLLDLATDSAFAVQAAGPVKALDYAQGAAPPEVVKAAATGTTIELAEPPGLTPAPGLSPAEAARLGSPTGTFDYTHLGPVGARVFAGMVRQEVEKAVPDLTTAFRR